jgi:hypothetical protein
LLNHLAYKSRRAYVFQDYVWAQHHYPWPESKAWEVPSRTPLGALLGGPIVGGPWAPGDAAPRSVHQSYWNIVCPKEKVKVIVTHEVKKKFGIQLEGSGKYVFNIWNKILLDEPAQCVEVRPLAGDPDVFSQTVFDLWLVGSERVLDLWEETRDSQVMQLLRTSPIVQRGVDRNQQLFKTAKTEHHDPFSRVLSLHLRRGDYLSHCMGLANWNSSFFMWNLLPWLPDRFHGAPGGEPGKNTDENVKEFLTHCLPDIDQILNKIASARDDYEKVAIGELRSSATALAAIS